MTWTSEDLLFAMLHLFLCSWLASFKILPSDLSTCISYICAPHKLLDPLLTPLILLAFLVLSRCFNRLFPPALPLFALLVLSLPLLQNPTSINLFKENVGFRVYFSINAVRFQKSYMLCCNPTVDFDWRQQIYYRKRYGTIALKIYVCAVGALFCEWYKGVGKI